MSRAQRTSGPAPMPQQRGNVPPAQPVGQPIQIPDILRDHEVRLRDHEARLMNLESGERDTVAPVLNNDTMVAQYNDLLDKYGLIMKEYNEMSDKYTTMKAHTWDLIAEVQTLKKSVALLTENSLKTAYGSQSMPSDLSSILKQVNLSSDSGYTPIH